MKTIYLTLASLFIAILFFQSCNKDTQETKPEFKLAPADSISQEEYDIYSLVINEFFSTKEVIISQRTNTSSYLKYAPYDSVLTNEEPNFDTTIYSNYEQINNLSYYFADNFTSDIRKIILITHEEFQYFFTGNDINSGWEEFHKEYPDAGGIISFTRIGFNSEKTQALFEISDQYGSLGGEGHIIYLAKENGKWVIKDTIFTWIS